MFLAGKSVRLRRGILIRDAIWQGPTLGVPARCLACVSGNGCLRRHRSQAGPSWGAAIHRGHAAPLSRRTANRRWISIAGQNGIDIVIDLRGSRKRERDLVTKLGMRYEAMPWHC